MRLYLSLQSCARYAKTGREEEEGGRRGTRRKAQKRPRQGEETRRQRATRGTRRKEAERQDEEEDEDDKAGGENPATEITILNDVFHRMWCTIRANSVIDRTKSIGSHDETSYQRTSAAAETLLTERGRTQDQIQDKVCYSTVLLGRTRRRRGRRRKRQRGRTENEAPTLQHGRWLNSAGGSRSPGWNPVSTMLTRP